MKSIPKADVVTSMLSRLAVAEPDTTADREITRSEAEPAAGTDTTQGPDVRDAEAPRPDAPNQVVASGAEFRSRLHWFIGTSDVTSRDPGSLTYEPYFGLREKPFSLSSDPRFFFSHSSHGAAFDTLAAGIRRREGLLVLTGEVGTGKTTLCRAVLQSLDQKTFAAFVPDPFLSREDLLKTLLVDFGVVSVDEVRDGRLRGASRAELSYPLYDFLTSLQPLKAFAVVMIDEAQNLTPELLEETRILSDLESGQKLLEVVLVGQPELKTRLATSAMRQLSQRVSVRCELSALSRQDVARYVSHRLSVAGNDGRVQFTDAAVELVWAASNGTPRVINLVCDRALLCAARARTMRVEAEHVVWAEDDLKLPVTGTFDQARALESFPEEVAAAPVEREDQPRPPQQETVLPAGVEPGDPFKSFLREIRPASAEREEPPQPPQGEVLSLPVSDVVATKPDGPARGVEPSPVSDRSGIDFWRTARGNPVVDVAGEGGYPSAVARTLALNVDLTAARQRRRRRLALVGAGVALIAAPMAYWYSTTQPRVALQSPPSPGNAVSVSPTNTSTPGTSPADVVLPAREGERTKSQDPVPGQSAPGFALQMATFQSAARAEQAVQEFSDAGYGAYSVEGSLRDGNRAFAVFLGPYTERASAERDRERVRQIPGYGSGLIVQLGPAVPSQKIQ